MAQFATAEELADRLGVDEFSATQEIRADSLLERASGVVQAAANQTIELVTDDELTVRGTREPSLLLPERPVVAVSAIAINDTDLDEGGWYLDGSELVGRSGWGCPADEILITYTHGHDPVPDAVKEIVLAAVTRVWVNPGSAVAERLGQAQMTWAVQGIPTGLLLTADERNILRRAVGAGSRSLPIR